ncbi:M20 family metallopeptidase [Halapricum desulfuricans]|uniref:Acetylornithine deacetylase/Succinyl-diaminopimelate desuccinylase or related deacylase n=1 Tax=Halapricum desulfuricans TaxID=2841257 RepID=A0A897NQA2_9EURY|nr:M20/M25/M40 family metallo-hydrolase [Halapricum desulfuricans]QSG14962.1 Acetylornithine deacetylase/Succinyl-diaminopimelate desuccinylase or related deacylase [Halapricum desulfuricans]
MSTAVTALARRLVATPSHDDPDAAGALLESWLREHTDATVERDEHGNVIARRGDGDRSLALVGHHDVVPPAPEQRDDGYLVEERDGRLFGRGSADMKGSLAAMACAFRDSDPAGELVFASFVGEERGGIGCRAAIEDGFAPDYAVVGEGSTGYSAPGVTDVAIAHRGRRASTITARGTAAHASEVGAGENAIYRATDAVDVIRDLPAPETTVHGRNVQGSLAVTEIDGGDAWNVIPDRCTVTVDERTVPGERAGLDAVESIEGVTWSVEQDLPPMACEDERFAAVALEIARNVQDGDPEHVVKPHATDAGWLAAEADTRTLVVGAAEPGEAHTAAESVSIPVLERCRRLYRVLAERCP